MIALAIIAGWIGVSIPVGFGAARFIRAGMVELQPGHAREEVSP